MYTSAIGALSSLNAFAGIHLDRAAEYRDDAAWLVRHASDPRSRYLLLDARACLLGSAAGPRWLSADERQRWFPQVPASLLGVADGRAWFSLCPSHEEVAHADLPTGHDAWLELRTAGLEWSPFAAGLFAYARALVLWQAATRYCSHCGAALELTSAGHRARCTSARCGQLHFPRTDAAIIVIVEHEGACLLGRQSTWPPGRYSTLAGFVEPGETLEDAVRREVAEEAGITVGECHYFSSQPWPFPASLMVGFVATALDRDIALRDGELEDARWFTPDSLVDGIGRGQVLPPSPVSVSWQLLAWWLRERGGVDLARMMADS